MRYFTLLAFISFSFITSDTNSQTGWFQQYSGTNNFLYNVFPVSSTECYISAQEGILKTTNGGTNWNLINLPTNYIPQNIFFTSQSTGYITTDYLSYYSHVLKTTNSGSNWFLILYEQNCLFTRIFFLNTQTGWIINNPDPYSACLYKTTNAGLNWTVQIVENEIAISDVQFCSSDSGYALGSSSGIYYFYKTFNGGINWTSLELPLYCMRLSFTNSLTGWALGTQNYYYFYIMKTNNGGSNWSPAYSAPQYLNNILLFTTNTGWAVGNNGKIIFTSNSGVNWITQQSTVNVNLQDIEFVNQTTGWIVGDNGTILKTTTGGNPIGIKPISTIIPKSYSLSQNYPNPFNPLTTIEFDIPNLSPLYERGVGGFLRQDGVVRLTVYDILGKQIELLVNQKLEPGSYRINFDGSSLSSGVYYYKLISGDFAETKKMVLLR